MPGMPKGLSKGECADFRSSPVSIVVSRQSGIPFGAYCTYDGNQTSGHRVDLFNCGINLADHFTRLQEQPRNH